MRVQLKGINPVKKKLADGRTVTYWYAWKGGPRLRGEKGSPEFFASYAEAMRQRATLPEGTLLALLRDYQDSSAFTGKAERTRRDYIEKIMLIEQAFGDFPIAALADPRTRGEFMGWRDRLAKSSPRQADYAWSVLSRVLSWALDRGKITVNPCTRGGRVYHGNRADKIWTDAQEAAFLAANPAHMRLPLLLAAWTGQRQGDLHALPWSACDGTHIRLRQSKTGAPVVIPVAAPLKAVLDAAERMGPIILTNTDDRPWTEDGFRSSWKKAVKRAGIVGVTFNDLRGTFVTRAAMAGCTEPEIAAITGHSLRDVRSILDAHYLHRDPALAENAIRKLERRTPTAQPSAQLGQS